MCADRFMAQYRGHTILSETLVSFCSPYGTDQNHFTWMQCKKLDFFFQCAHFLSWIKSHGMILVFCLIDDVWRFSSAQIPMLFFSAFFFKWIFLSFLIDLKIYSHATTNSSDKRNKKKATGTRIGDREAESKREQYTNKLVKMGAIYDKMLFKQIFMLCYIKRKMCTHCCVNENRSRKIVVCVDRKRFHMKKTIFISMYVRLYKQIHIQKDREKKKII